MDLCRTEEMEAIQAMYYRPNEFRCIGVPGGQYVTIRFDFNLPGKTGAERGGFHAFLPRGYPSTIPKKINVFCDDEVLPEQMLQSFKLKVEERADTLKGEPMLFDLLCFAQELMENSIVVNNDYDNGKNIQIADADCTAEESLSNDVSEMHLNSAPGTSDKSDSHCYVNLKSQPQTMDSDLQCDNTTDVDVKSQPGMSDKSDSQHPDTDSNRKSDEGRNSPASSESSGDEEKLMTALLQLNHMRSKQKYIKTILGWTSTLGLTGRLLFYGKFIFIILQGGSLQIQEYIIRNRTVMVDVDSKGKSCKERMLSVLCQVSSKEHFEFQDFTSIEEIASFDDFSNMFESFSMTDLFQEHIAPRCTGSGRTRRSGRRRK